LAVRGWHGAGDAEFVGGDVLVCRGSDPDLGMVRGLGSRGGVGDQGAQPPLLRSLLGGRRVPECGQVGGEFLQLRPAGERRQTSPLRGPAHARQSKLARAAETGPSGLPDCGRPPGSPGLAGAERRARRGLRRSGRRFDRERGGTADPWAGRSPRRRRKEQATLRRQRVSASQQSPRRKSHRRCGGDQTGR